MPPRLPHEMVFYFWFVSSFGLFLAERRSNRVEDFRLAREVLVQEAIPPMLFAVHKLAVDFDLKVAGGAGVFVPRDL